MSGIVILYFISGLKSKLCCVTSITTTSHLQSVSEMMLCFTHSTISFKEQDALWLSNPSRLHLNTTAVESDFAPYSLYSALFGGDFRHRVHGIFSVLLLRRKKPLRVLNELFSSLQCDFVNGAENSTWTFFMNGGLEARAHTDQPPTGFPRDRGERERERGGFTCNSAAALHLFGLGLLRATGTHGIWGFFFFFFKSNNSAANYHECHLSRRGWFTGVSH